MEPFTSPCTITWAAVIRACTRACSSTVTCCWLSISPWTAPRTRIERSERTVPSMVAPSPMTVSPGSAAAAARLGGICIVGAVAAGAGGGV
jgi:hypothetical protein